MMAWFHQTLARCAALFRRGRLDRELEEDVATHIALLTEEYISRGMDPVEARRQARLSFGSVDSAMEIHRDVRSLRWVESAFQDLRYAARLLRRQPLLSCAVVLTLGIGIGAPVAAFSLLNKFTFGRPPSADPDAFFRLARPASESSGIATPLAYETLRASSRSARELAAWSIIELRGQIGTEDPTPVEGVFVSCNFFRLFGVHAPVAGRLLDESDCAAGAPVAVISERLWRDRFGADEAIIGASIRYGGSPVTIAGVASAPPFHHEWDDADFAADIWVPYTAQRSLKGPAEFLNELMHHDGFRWLNVAGFLSDGVSRSTAEAELRAIDAGLPGAARNRAHAPIVLTDGSRWAAAPLTMLGLLAMALALPALVMLTACVNVAALLLPRAVIRQREMAVRLTLGTSKARLMRMLLVESLLVCGLAAIGSLVLVYTLPPILVRFFDLELAFGGADALAPDWRVFACLVFAGVLAAVFSGLTPALESLNPRLADTLKGPRGLIFRQRHSRSRRVFVGIQIAASMVLLVVAATFWRAAERFTDPGFRTAGVLVADLRDQPKPGVPLASIADEIRTAGVRTVAYASTLPLVTESARGIRIGGERMPLMPLIVAVSPDYFRVLDISVLAGQAFESNATSAGAGFKPIVVSRQFARRFFGNGNPIGEVVELIMNAGPTPMRIIGVVADRDVGRSNFQPALTDGSIIYEPMPAGSRSGHLLVAAEGDAAAAAAALRTVLRNVTGAAAPVQTLQASLAQRVDGVRRMQVVLLAMGAVSLALAIIGVIGAVSADATQRRKEFAIRLAIGATPWHVRRTIITSGLRVLPFALAAGAVASWGALKAGQNLLPVGAVAADPAPYVAIAVFLLATAVATLLAVSYPAGRRDPVIALREE
ncbi:MAG: ABC transporter permease [Vicinamibacterales bacterium]